MSRDGWVRMPHDLIVGPGQMDESVDVGGAGLQDYAIFHGLLSSSHVSVAGKELRVQYVSMGQKSLLNTRILSPGAVSIFTEKFVGLGMDF